MKAYANRSQVKYPYPSIPRRAASRYHTGALRRYYTARIVDGALAVVTILGVVAIAFFLIILF